MLAQGTIRKQNINRIWDILISKPMVTRQELAAKTSLSLMSVTNLVDHLNRHHVLTFTPMETKMVAGHKMTGRRADMISLSQENHAWMIIDLTDRHFRFFALALDRSVLHAGMPWVYDELHDYRTNLVGFLRRCRQTAETELRQREILGAAVIAPGPYDIAADRIHNTRIPEINPLAIKQLLREQMGMYDYYVDEDVKFAVRAYMFQAAQSGSEVLYYLYIGEGIGGAAIHEGNMLRGMNAVAGDAGQLPAPSGDVYETLLSLRAFAFALGMEDTRELSEDGLLKKIDAIAFDDPARFRARLMEAAGQTAQMLYSVVWMLDPREIVVDCCYARSMEKEYIDRVSECLRTRLNGALQQTVQVLPALHDRRSVLYGAVQVLSREWISRIV